jgi:hypothetical protein
MHTDLGVINDIGGFFMQQKLIAHHQFYYSSPARTIAPISIASRVLLFTHRFAEIKDAHRSRRHQ